MIIVLHVPMTTTNNEINTMIESIHRHFLYKVKETEISLKEKFRQWKVNMTVGVAFLTVCLILIEFFKSNVDTSIIRMAKESLVIGGWVALWEPLTFILFGWQPIWKKKLYFKKISIMTVSVEKYICKEKKII